jgi:uncharacterized protein
VSDLSRTLTLLPRRYAICRLSPDEGVPAWALSPSDFVSITRSRAELSVICPASAVPAAIPRRAGWHCLRIDGSTSLDEPGVLVSVVDPLAAAGLSVFAVASYDTDHLLVTDLNAAIEALHAAGHRVVGVNNTVKLTTRWRICADHSGP